MRYPKPNVPYVEARHQSGKQRPTAIILRPSFTNSEDGAALAVAQYWHKSASFWDAGHYTVDSRKRFRCVRDNVIAGANDVDKGAIRIAICADPVSKTYFWDKNLHGAVLKNTAELVSELTLAYAIRPVYLDPEGKQLWEARRTRRRGGIYVTETSGWPFEDFLDEVKAQRSLKTHI